jgi:hypothetical protein
VAAFFHAACDCESGRVGPNCSEPVNLPAIARVIQILRLLASQKVVYRSFLQSSDTRKEPEVLIESGESTSSS